MIEKPAEGSALAASPAVPGAYSPKLSAPQPLSPQPHTWRRPIRRQRRPVRHEVSAGGVVMRTEGQQWLVALLLTEHKRGQVWVLPKGHVELHTGERVSSAAKREVQEEAGLRDLSVKDQLGVSRFTFQAEEALVRKTVHYYLMITQQKELVPQQEEGLLQAAWFPLEEAIQKLAYDTDKDIVRRAGQRLGVAGAGSSKRVSRIHS